MLHRFVNVVRCAASAARSQVSVRPMSGYDHAAMPLKDVAREHGNEINRLPVPEGSWQENYNSTQRRYNLQLVAATLAFIATMAYMQLTGVNLTHTVSDYKKLNIDPTKPLPDKED